MRGQRKQPGDNHKRPLSLYLLLPFMLLRSSLRYVTPSRSFTYIHHQSLLLRYYIHTNVMHTNMTQNHSSHTGCHRDEFPHVIRLTQSNLYVILLLWIHTSTQHVLSLRPKTEASAILLRQTHPKKTWTHLLTNQNIIFKKTSRHRWLNISMNYCGYCSDWKSHAAIRLSRLLARP